MCGEEQVQRPCSRNGLPVFKYKFADLCVWSVVSEGRLVGEVERQEVNPRGSILKGYVRGDG